MLRVSTALLLMTIAFSACDAEGTGTMGKPGGSGSCTDQEFRSMTAVAKR